MARHASTIPTKNVVGKEAKRKFIVRVVLSKMNRATERYVTPSDN
jgi:hypothetical protein